MADTVLILFVIAYGILSALILWNVAGFFKHFHRGTQLLVAQMDRAERPEEYCCWQKKLRCHYLCLIPFVNHRNVEKVYAFFYHRQKPAKVKKSSSGIFHILAPSAVGACLCAICLCGMSWAWFTASTVSDAQSIKTPQYTITQAVQQNETLQIGTLSANGSTEYTLPFGTYTVTLTTSGTENATGYCIVKLGDTTYYTEQIPANSTFSFSVQVNGMILAVFTPAWGSSAERTDENQISAGAVLQAEGTLLPPTTDEPLETTTETTTPEAPDQNVVPSGTNTAAPSEAVTEPVTSEAVTTAGTEPPAPATDEQETTTALPEEGTSAAEETTEIETETEPTTADTKAPEEIAGPTDA